MRVNCDVLALVTARGERSSRKFLVGLAAHSTSGASAVHMQLGDDLKRLLG
jgi:hypothetical protein